MKRTVAIVLAVMLLTICLPQRAFAQYERSYKNYIRIATEAIRDEDFQTALFYLQAAHAVKPGERLTLRYINLIKRILDRQVQHMPQEDVLVHHEKPAAGLSSVAREGQTHPSRLLPFSQLTKKIAPPQVSEPIPATLALELDDALWARQPNTRLELIYQQQLLLHGSNIERHLVITPGVLDVQQPDRDTLLLTAQQRGSTFFHIWDDRGRWTFHIVVNLPPQATRATGPAFERHKEIYAEPFRFTYNNFWNAFYEGDDVPGLSRESLIVRQTLGLAGETPYGDVDASVVLNKFDEKTNADYYTIGLIDGKIGNFNDFTIRGFDNYARFSDLTLPGRYFRGAALQAYAFDRNMKYQVLRGQDRSTFGVISTGTQDDRDSFLEGARITLFPEGDHQVTLNYARGFGDDREDFLQNTTYSLETRNRLHESFEVMTELGYDEDEYAGIIKTFYETERSSLGINFRDIHENYSTVTGRPLDLGEIGTNMFWRWRPDGYYVTSHVDIYQDREFPNDDETNTVNFEWDGSLDIPLSRQSRWRTAAFYVKTPQLISSRESLRVTNRYTRDFQLGPTRSLTTFISGAFQRNRNDTTPISEFDRYSVLSGLQLPLVKYLNYFANFEYSWVKQLVDDDFDNPFVLTTGLSYARPLWKSFLGRMSLTYRDEEHTDGDFSFLAGEDSLAGNIGLTYRPNSDFEVFMDGRLRTIWAENDDARSFNDADIRLGVRTSWDLLFRWNPSGVIAGQVFKDYNRNGLREDNEPGIPGVKIRVGEKEVVSDHQGKYRVPVSAKRLQVALDLDSIGKGYVFSTDLVHDVQVQHQATQYINFGLTTRSSIYGVVYWDRNQNRKVDFADEVLPSIRIILDGDQSAQTDFDGSYVFDNISPGRHEIRLDINSVPLTYLPTIKLQNTVDVTEGTTYIFNIPMRKK